MGRDLRPRGGDWANDIALDPQQDASRNARRRPRRSTRTCRCDARRCPTGSTCSPTAGCNGAAWPPYTCSASASSAANYRIGRAPEQTTVTIGNDQAIDVFVQSSFSSRVTRPPHASRYTSGGRTVRSPGSSGRDRLATSEVGLDPAADHCPGISIPTQLHARNPCPGDPATTSPPHSSGRRH
jgi:hypothetical protein